MHFLSLRGFVAVGVPLAKNRSNLFNRLLRIGNARNDAVIHCHYEDEVRDKVGQSPSNPLSTDCHDDKSVCTLCVPIGNDKKKFEVYNSKKSKKFA